jgi:DNA polymerase III sliding clamp (beta) subunit (PCNA family)
MKVVVASAGPLARALGLAASLVPADKKFAAVWVVNLVSADDGSVLLTRNVLDFQVTLKVPATIARPGSLAVPSDRLARLVAGFPATAEIVVETEGSAARVRSGRSHYRLPVTTLEDLPLALTVLEDGKLELSRAQAALANKPAHHARQRRPPERTMRAFTSTTAMLA